MKDQGNIICKVCGHPFKDHQCPVAVSAAAPKAPKPSRVAHERLVLPRTGDTIQDDYGTMICRGYSNGYVICGRKGALAGVMSLREWRNREKRQNEKLSHCDEKEK